MKFIQRLINKLPSRVRAREELAFKRDVLENSRVDLDKGHYSDGSILYAWLHHKGRKVALVTFKSRGVVISGPDALLKNAPEPKELYIAAAARKLTRKKQLSFHNPQWRTEVGTYSLTKNGKTSRGSVSFREDKPLRPFVKIMDINKVKFEGKTVGQIVTEQEQVHSLRR